MIALTGSQKQIDWASKIRDTQIAIVRTNLEARGLLSNPQAAQLITAMETIPAATWWIDNKDWAAFNNIAAAVGRWIKEGK